MKTQELYQVDAFASELFTGNPAGVCILESWLPEETMQAIALENNLAETAFAVRVGECYEIRWFTPEVEVELCGHATLASAHILWEQGILAPESPARFHTRSGLLSAVRKDAWIEMDFPAEPETLADFPSDIFKAFGADARYVGKNRFDFLLEFESDETIRKMAPNFSLLSHVSSRGFIVTSTSDSDQYDFMSRFFAPAAGINEDPVTGSAHCCLGPYWAEKLGKNELTGYQASKRGGVVKVRVGDERVYLSGQAITVMRATLF